MLSKWKLFLCIETAMRAWSGAAKIAGMYNARNIANQMHLTWKPQGLKASVGSTPEELFALVHRVLIKTSLKWFHTLDRFQEANYNASGLFESASENCCALKPWKATKKSIYLLSGHCVIGVWSDQMGDQVYLQRLKNLLDFDFKVLCPWKTGEEHQKLSTL